MMVRVRCLKAAKRASVVGRAVVRVGLPAESPARVVPWAVSC